MFKGRYSSNKGGMGPEDSDVHVMNKQFKREKNVRHNSVFTIDLFQPAYSYSVENQALTESLYKQQDRLHLVYSSIAGKLVRVCCY